LAERFDVTVLTTDPSRRLAREETTNAGVRVVRVPSWPPKGDLFFAPGLIGPIRSGGWDIVHVQGYHTLTAPMAMAAARWAAAPLVVTFHSGGDVTALRRRQRWLQHLVLRPLLRGARRLVAVSAFERDALAARLRLARARFTVIPNGFDLPRDAGPDIGAGERSEGTMVLSIGRLQRYKGHQHVIRAMPHVLRHRPDAWLRIAGDGPDRAYLERLAAEEGIGDRVWVEPAPPDDRQGMARLLGRASVVAVLSAYESQGLAAWEAASLGRPLVVADGTALHELVAVGAARGVAPDATPGSVAEALVAELDSGRREPVAARTWDQCAADLGALYDEILGTG
jgi:glycosyltransferase involved in cell wall biosynthesis